MELEEHTKALHMEHKNHLASLIMNNAKSSLASGLPESIYNKVGTTGVGSNNNNRGGDDLGNSSTSQKSNDGSTKKTEPPAKKMNTGRWSAEEHKRFLDGLDQFG